jgi:pyroglutamyl-peptidase
MGPKKIILLTGFEPFGGESINPSWEAVRALEGKTMSDGSVIAVARLPCTFVLSLDVLEQLIRMHKPRIVVCVGQAGGRAELSIERVAINVDDARIPDNAGAQPIDVQIRTDGPAAYFSTLPIKAIVAALNEKGIPAAVSQTAGTFVCNHVFYGLMQLVAQAPKIKRAGFVHIPFLPEQAIRHPNTPSMSLEVMVAGLLQIIESTLTMKTDLVAAGGSTH